MWSGVESAGVSSKPLGNGNETSTYDEGTVDCGVWELVMGSVAITDVAVDVVVCLTNLTVLCDKKLLDLLIKRAQQTSSKPQLLLHDDIIVAPSHA